ncbi:family 16 glycosylhydrolase [Zobellia galactanivorans]|uniref:family 16 glycosylhydrolase n=1 Tax=Zobellia galactanivorans (strain DSM 12802 / CCUG 47099 / CIP 106680 / NCIMB 13871 / Dsij) TaxID=63186 RepID=UPI001C07DBA7|nr:family 16 glycosylhydrolase [Zobellia galactanivorans]MBU3024757.1 family 16 glycosylhydrolase [Zobellia galactanivorans]
MIKTLKRIPLVFLIAIMACSNSGDNGKDKVEEQEQAQEQGEKKGQGEERDKEDGIDGLQPTFLADQDPKPDDKKWIKVEGVSDEFNDSELDLTKWSPTPEFIWNGQDRGWYGGSRSLFEADNVSVGNGFLRIEGEKFDSPKYSPKDNTDTPPQRRYGGAYVYGKTLAEPGYYIEARMRASKTAMSAAFWLKTETKPCGENLYDGENLEIDIQECVGVFTGELGDEWTKDDWAVNANWDRIFHYNTHRHNSPCNNIGDRQTKGGKANFDKKNSDEFHIYAAYWHADGSKIDFYIDGELEKSITPVIPFKGALRLIMSSNFYDWIEETSAEDMGFNRPLEDRYTQFDWVRVWQLEDL